MKSSILNNVLNGVIGGDVIQRSTHTEVASYAQFMTKIGATNPIIFNEDEKVTLDRTSILKRSIDQR